MQQLTFPHPQTRPVVFLVLACVAALSVGAFVAQLGTFALGTVVAAALALLAALLVLRSPWLGIAGVFLAVLPGQFVRFSLGTDARGGAAILLTDLVLPVALAALVVRRWGAAKPLPKSTVLGPLALFTGVALLSLIAGVSVVTFFADAPAKPFLIGTMYWLRFVLYAGFFLLALEALRTRRDLDRMLVALMGVGVALALIGFVQLWLIPDFTTYAVLAGWDPHQGRLLSSFFDPNFMGTYFAMLLALILALLLDPARSVRRKLLLALAGSVMLVAFLLTYSRGALLGLAVAFTIITLLRSPRIFVAGAIGLVLVIAGVPRFTDRILAGLSIDETGVKRIESWTKGVKIVAAYPLLGTGYNTLATVQDGLGLVTEDDVNNRGGFENSLLTVAASTGVLGLLAYLWYLVAQMRVTFGLWTDKRRDGRVRHLGLGVGGALVAALVASLTLNALFYPAILLQTYALLALAERQRDLASNA